MNRLRTFFCDESCHTNHLFLGVGGIYVENADIVQFWDDIKAIKKETQFKRLEWKKLRRAIKQNDPLQDLMNLFFKKNYR